MKGSSRCSRCGRAVETEGSLCSSCTAAVDRDNKSALISQGAYLDAEAQPAANGSVPPRTEAQGPLTPRAYALGLLGWATLLATVVPVLRPYVYVFPGNVPWGWILAGALIIFFHGERAWKWPLVATVPLSVAINPVLMINPLAALPFVTLYYMMPLGIGLFAGSVLRSWWSRVPEDPVTPAREGGPVLGRLRRPHFRIAAGTLGAALLLLLVNPWGAVGGSVTFPDANLEAAVRQALWGPTGGHSAGPVSPWRMRRLSDLGAVDMRIESLGGLEHARRLKHIDLSNNSVSDLSPIAGLQRLDELYASHNAIVDLSPLAGLQRLTILDLSGNCISDLSPIDGLQRLAHLFASHNAIVDLSPLAGLQGLRFLDLTGNPIEDFSPITELGAWHLGVSVTEASDPSPLAAMTSLTRLDLSRSVLTPEQLSQLPDGHLFSLILRHSNLTDAHLQALASRESTLSLDVSHNAITDIGPLGNVGFLEELYLSHNAVSDLTPLVNIPGLEWVDLSHNAVTDLTPLANMSDAWEVQLHHNAIRDISPLLEMESLGWVSLYGNPLDLGPGSETAQQLAQLQARGVWVQLEPTETWDDDPGRGANHLTPC